MRKNTKDQCTPADPAVTNPGRSDSGFGVDSDDLRLPDDDFDFVRMAYELATEETDARPSGGLPDPVPQGGFANARPRWTIASNASSEAGAGRMSFSLPLEVLMGNHAFFNESRPVSRVTASNPHWVGCLSDLIDHFGFWIVVLLTLEAWNSLKIAALLNEYLLGGVWILAGSVFAVFWVFNSVLWFRFRNGPSSRFILPGGILLVLMFAVGAALHLGQAIPFAD